MGKLVNSLNEAEVPVPRLCPRCGASVIFNGESYICTQCKKELYYDRWLGIFRLRSVENEEDD